MWLLSYVDTNDLTEFLDSKWATTMKKPAKQRSEVLDICWAGNGGQYLLVSLSQVFRQ